MNRQQGWVLLLAAALWLGCAPPATAGWITLTSGSSGRAQPTGTAEFWYGSGATPRLAVDGLSGVGTVQATTGGGVAFFSSLGLPVLLDLSDGTATVAGGSPPAEAVAGGPDGSPLGAGASAAPVAGGAVTPEYARLGVALVADADGRWVLTASVFGPGSDPLGSASVVVPEGGWWLLGLGGDARPGPDPNPGPGPGPGPGPEPNPGPGPAPGVPEPGALALAASGAALVLPWLRRRRAAGGR